MIDIMLPGDGFVNMLGTFTFCVFKRERVVSALVCGLPFPEHSLFDAHDSAAVMRPKLQEEIIKP